MTLEGEKLSILIEWLRLVFPRQEKALNAIFVPNADLNVVLLSELCSWIGGDAFRKSSANSIVVVHWIECFVCCVQMLNKGAI